MIHVIMSQKKILENTKQMIRKLDVLLFVKIHQIVIHSNKRAGMDLTWVKSTEIPI